MKTSQLCVIFLIVISLPAMTSTVFNEETKLKSPQHTLIYSYDEMFNFDIEAYLASQAPHLLPYAEVISHWAGYSSISPRVLLTLLEQQSSLVTQPQKNPAIFNRPFGELSDKEGFAEQLQDIANQLANRVYVQDRTDGAAEFAGINKSTFALDMLFATSHLTSIRSTKELQQADEIRAQFTKLYYQLFQLDFQPLEALPEPSEIQTQAPNGFLQFPFPLGQSWHIGGAHTNTGWGNYPLSSLDMSRGGGWGSNQSNVWVAASAAGQFKRHSSCFAEIVHANGWSTTYYHLMNIQYATGANINRNTRIANPAHTRGQALCNGGSSTGPHLHWSLKRYGQWYHLNGAYLSGWRITAQGYSYDTHCSRFYLTRNGWWGCAGYYSH